MTIDVELTLNRFGFSRPAKNKMQIGPIRISWWNVGKRSISFEVNWKSASEKKWTERKKPMPGSVN